MFIMPCCNRSDSIVRDLSSTSLSEKSGVSRWEESGLLMIDAES
jgi:hypothetical protein